MASKVLTSTARHHLIFPEFVPQGPERVRGPLLGHRNHPHRRWSGQLHIRNVSNCGSRFKYSRLPESSGGLRCPLVCGCRQCVALCLHSHLHLAPDMARRSSTSSSSGTFPLAYSYTRTSQNIALRPGSASCYLYLKVRYHRVPTVFRSVRRRGRKEG
jgi:hypothetical protein